MNRKLRHTILAFSVTGMMLAIGLLVARPLTDARGTPTARLHHDAGAPPSIDGRATLRNDLRHRQQHHSALVDIAATEQAVAAVASVLAALVLEEDVAGLVEEAAAEVELEQETCTRSWDRKGCLHPLSVGASGAAAGGKPALPPEVTVG